MGFLFLYIKACTQLIIMYYFLWFLFAFAHAEWPPSTCDQETLINKNDVVLTSARVETSGCTLKDSFEDRIFVKMSRSGGLDSVADDSLLVLRLESEHKKAFLADIEVFNEYVAIGPGKKCKFNSVGNPVWLRARLLAMVDTRKTQLSVALSGVDDLNFQHCATLMLDDVHHSFRLRFEGDTKYGMRQTVHNILKDRPERYHIDKIEMNGHIDKVESELGLRMDRFEERLRRLQNTITEYVNSHDRHVLLAETNHKKLSSAITGTHNRIVTRTNAHGKVYFFFLAMIVVCGMGYIRWKSTEESRFHMP